MEIVDSKVPNHVKSLPFLKEDVMSADKNLLYVMCSKMKVL